MEQLPHSDAYTILDSITDGFFALDSNWRITFINKTVEKRTGRRREDFIGKYVWDVFSPDCYKRSYAAYEKVMTEKVTVFYDEYLPKSGQWLQIRIYPGDNGLSVYYHDVSEEVKLKEKLRVSEQQLSVLINNTQNPIWSVNRQCELQVCNDAFCNWIYCYNGIAVKVGDYLLDARLGHSYLERFEICYQIALSGKTISAVEDYQADGVTHYISFTLNPVLDDAGKVTGLSCFAQDITESRQHKMQIEAQNAKLTEIAAIQSHKIRGPVATILGLAQLFNTEDPADPTNADVIRGVTAVAETLDNAIKDVVAKTNETDQ